MNDRNALVVELFNASLGRDLSEEALLDLRRLDVEGTDDEIRDAIAHLRTIPLVEFSARGEILTAPGEVAQHHVEMTGNTGPFRLRQASTVTPERVRWAWARRVPLGGVTLLPGREGLGKSTMAYELAARITRGQLEGDLRGEPADVVAIGDEDMLAAVAVPRLIAAGADMHRVWFLESTDDESVAAFSVPGDVPALEQLLDGLENPRLAIVDPLDAHLAADTHKKADTQRAIGTLARIAQRRVLSVLGIAHHSKAPTTDPLDRVNGSKAFTTSVRSVLTIAPHPENDDERVVAVSKSNLTANGVPVLSFKIETRVVEGDEDDIETSGVVWLGEADIHPDEILVRPSQDDDRGEREDAEAALREVLADGPVWVKVALDAMAAAGFSKDQAKRAKSKIGARSVKVGFPGDPEVGWQWSLREHKGSEERTPLGAAPLTPLALPLEDEEAA